MQVSFGSFSASGSQPSDKGSVWFGATFGVGPGWLEVAVGLSSSGVRSGVMVRGVRCVGSGMDSSRGSGIGSW